MKTVNFKITLADYKDTEERQALELRVTYGSTRQYYAVGFRVTKEDYTILQGNKVTKRLGEIKERMEYALGKAKDVKKKLEPFDFDKFRKEYLNEYGSNDVLAGFIQKEKELRKDGKEGTADTYRSARNSLSSFKKNIKYSDITPIFLKEYQRWLLSQNVTEDRKHAYATIGIYLRNLRHILNRAIADGLLPREKYPFGGIYGHKIITGRNIKKACTIEEIYKIMQYAPVSDREAQARDIWLLSYFCNGMNFKDILHLKNSNLGSDEIVFVRAKTSGKDQEPIVVSITPPLRELLNKYAIRNIKPNTLLFPFLPSGLTEKDELKARRNFIRNTNKYMRRIAAKLSIDKKMTTYYARHSYATILDRQGVNRGLIGGNMGHATSKTTDGYFEGFENEAIKKTAELLIPKMG